MNTGGWITMILSVTFVTVLFAYCIYKVLTAPPPAGEHIHSTVDIDTKDVE